MSETKFDDLFEDEEEEQPTVDVLQQPSDFDDLFEDTPQEVVQTPNVPVDEIDVLGEVVQGGGAVIGGSYYRLGTVAFSALGSLGQAVNVLDNLAGNPNPRGQNMVDAYYDFVEGKRAYKDVYGSDFEDRVLWDMSAGAMDALMFAGLQASAAKQISPTAQALQKLFGPGVSQTPKLDLGRQVLAIDEFAIHPARTVATEMGLVAGFEGGFAIGEEMFPEHPAVATVFGIGGSVTGGGVTNLVTRLGGREAVDVLKNIVEGSIDNTGRLPGKTLEETVTYTDTIMEELSEPAYKGRLMTDQFILENIDAAAGPLFRPDDLSEQLKLRLTKEGDIPEKLVDDLVAYANREFLRGDPSFDFSKVIKDDADEINDFFDRSFDASLKERMPWWKKVEHKVRDMESAVRSRLGRLGPEGKSAEIAMSTERGARPFAEYEAGQYRKTIFNGLSRSGHRILAKYVMAVRGQQVENARPSINQARKAAGKKEQGPFLNEEWGEGDYLNAAKRTLDEAGPVARTDIDLRARHYFKAWEDQLVKLRANQLISENEFQRLKRFVYSPKQFIDNIDPRLEEVIIGNTKFSVTASGIRPLEGGRKGLLDMSLEQQLNQAVVRVNARIARNKVGLSLHRLAGAVPDNGMVALKKEAIGDNAVKFSARRIDPDTGEAKNVSYWVDPELAKVLLDNKGIGDTGQILSLVSGSRVTKALVTGADPTFILRQFPRDVMFAVMTSGQYNRYLLPKGFADLAVDLAETMKDAVRREGDYVEYMKEGGGMNFLSHAARLSEIDNTKMDPRVKDMARGLTYINETAEIWMRLAVRKRALKNGKSPDEATFIARDYIDFSDGSPLTKTADAMTPYVNVAYIASRNALRAAKKDPVAFSVASGQLMGAFAYLYAQGKMAHPELYDDISPRIQESHIIVPLGVSRSDAEGNIRHGYLAVPIEQTMIPLKKVADGLMKAHINGEVPPVELMATLDTFSKAFAPAGFTPPIAAIGGAVINRDASRRWNKVWTQTPVEFNQEFLEFPDDNPTSAFARDTSAAMSSVGLGKLATASPERLETMAGAIGLAQNDFAKAFAGVWGVGRELAIGEQIHPEMTWQQQAKMFNFRLFKETNPLHGKIDDWIENNRSANTPEFQAKRALAKEVALDLAGNENALTRAKIMELAASMGQSDAIGAFPGALTNKLQTHVANIYETERIFNIKGVPPEYTKRKSEVMYIASANPQLTARWYVDEWKAALDDRDPRTKNDKLRFLGTVRRKVPGFRSREFNQWFGIYMREEE